MRPELLIWRRQDDVPGLSRQYRKADRHLTRRVHKACKIQGPDQAGYQGDADHRLAEGRLQARSWPRDGDGETAERPRCRLIPVQVLNRPLAIPTSSERQGGCHGSTTAIPTRTDHAVARV